MAKPLRIPLIGQPTQRGEAISLSSDQKFLNCIFQKVTNPITGATLIRCNKRPGVAIGSAVQASTYGQDVLVWSGNNSMNLHLHVASGGTTIYLYKNITSAALIDSDTGAGLPSWLSETTITGTTDAPMLVVVSNGIGWYMSANTEASGTTFIGDTHSGTKIIDNINTPDTTNLAPGMLLTHADIPAGNRIASVDSSSQVTMVSNQTASHTGQTITHSKLAKMISSNLATAMLFQTGRPVHMDGYMFFLTSFARLYNTDLNTVNAMSSSSQYLTVGNYPDQGVALERIGNIIVAFGSQSIEFFSNTGNATGSPLTSYAQPISIGLPSQYCTLAADSTVYFIGRTRDGEYAVYRFDGLSPKPISNGVINAWLSQNTGVIVHLSRLDISGRSLLLAISQPNSTPASATAWALDMATGIWSPWTSGISGTMFSRISKAGNDATTSFMVDRGVAAASVYKIDELNPVFQDSASSTVTRTIITQRIDFGTNNRKSIPALRLVGDQKASTYNIGITFSDDDYANNSASRNIDMSLVNPQITRCGMFRRRSITLTDSNNGDCGLEALEFPAIEVSDS